MLIFSSAESACTASQPANPSRCLTPTPAIVGRFVHHDDIDQGLAGNDDGQDDAGDHDVVDDFCPTLTLFFSGLLGQLGERWLKTALLRRQGHGNPPMGDAIDALVALGKAKHSSQRTFAWEKTSMNILRISF